MVWLLLNIKPTGQLDEMCMEHDYCYTNDIPKKKKKKKKKECDEEMLKDLKKKVKAKHSEKRFQKIK